MENFSAEQQFYIMTAFSDFCMPLANFFFGAHPEDAYS
jgi:hypothetical protein